MNRAAPTNIFSLKPVLIYSTALKNWSRKIYILNIFHLISSLFACFISFPKVEKIVFNLKMTCYFLLFPILISQIGSIMTMLMKKSGAASRTCHLNKLFWNKLFNLYNLKLRGKKSSSTKRFLLGLP